MRAVVAIVAVAAALAVPLHAAFAQDPTSRLSLSLRLDNTGTTFLSRLLDNCGLFFSNGTSPSGGRFVTAGGQGEALGSVDFARRSGETYTRGLDWQAEAIFGGRGRVKFDDLGVALAKRTVYLTARITRGRALASGARRQRIGVIRRARFDSGPLRDRSDREVPNTYSVAVTGRLAMRPAMARGINRVRCPSRVRNPQARRFPAGYPMGRFVVELRPDKATGLEGVAGVRFGVSPVVVRSGAGAQPEGNGFVAPLTAGLPAPLACVEGASCIPSGGRLGIGGTYELVNGDRRAVVAALEVTSAGPASDPQRTVTGTLDGTPVAVAAGRGEAMTLTGEFSERAGAALGTEVSGILTVEPRFTRTGP